MTNVPLPNGRYDVVIVGARCSGAATALLLARAGVRVLVVDRQAYGTDRLSTHALMRGAVLQLNRWGVLDRILRAGTPTVRDTTFHYGDEEIRLPIKSEAGVDFLCAPRRTVLDRVLVDAAVEAGAEFLHGVSLTALHTRSDGRVTGVQMRDPEHGLLNIRAGMVIGADGRQSMVARLTGARSTITANHTTAAVYGYFQGLPDDGFHWYYRPGIAAGAIPTNDGAHCVFTCVPQPEFGDRFRPSMKDGYLATLAENNRALAEAVKAATPAGRLYGFAGAPGFMRTAHGPGWALVGDAGYFKDPLTAHGITDALRDAEILARAVLQGNERALALYQAERDALSHELFEITDRVASFQWDLEEIKALHMDLNKSMRTEVRHMTAVSPRIAAAA